jgi:hypothetical protein
MTLVFVIVAVVAIAGILAVWLRSPRGADGPLRIRTGILPSEPAAFDPSALREREEEPAAPITWPLQFNPSSALDDEARLKLIEDLALLRAPWCVPLLAQAYDEERKARHLRAVLRALDACRHETARTTFQRALRSDDAEAQVIAEEALRRLDEVAVG